MLGLRNNLERGRKFIPQPEACLHTAGLGCSERYPARSTNLWTEADAVCPRKKKNPFLFLAILFPKVVIWGLWAPQGTRIQQGNGRTMNWKIALILRPDCVCFFKTVSAPSHVGTSLSAAQNYQKSLLMIVFKNAAIFCLHFVSLPLYFQFFWVTHCQRMLFWLSCMFSLSSVDKSLPQTLCCP